MRVLRLTTEDAETWSRVGDGGILVSDIVDRATVPEAKMTVGYARLGRGEALDISFPYDEVLVLTKGSCTVRTEDGEEVGARASEVIYLPAGSSNSSHAEEDTEMVYVAHPPCSLAWVSMNCDAFPISIMGLRLPHLAQPVLKIPDA